MAESPPADLVHAPVDVQAAAFTRIVAGNPVCAAVLDRLPELGVPSSYLAAGALHQTVWNHLTGHAACAGIRDYDVVYFDPTDLSWEAEDSAIRRAARTFADLPGAVEVHNQARVHLWYEAKFGVPCPPYTSTEAAIATFPTTSSCLGIRGHAGRWRVYAPFGFTDVFAMCARPNPALAPRQVYEARTARWQRQWPGLTVLPWNGGGGG